jgi:hypothetical protein
MLTNHAHCPPLHPTPVILSGAHSAEPKDPEKSRPN